jgi:arylsulfatase A-like enzyme
VIALDIFATASAAAGVNLPKDRVIDSVDLIPYLKAEVTTAPHEPTTAPHESLFWRFGEQQAIRKGQYKLLKLRNGEEHLFDLKQDIGEKRDLLGERTEIVADLRAEFAKWNSQLANPLWGQAGARRAQ